MKQKLKNIWLLMSTFFKVGLFTFGGGLAMLPIIEREVVEKYKWLKPEEMLDLIAIAESTPGAIAVNTATFIGYKVKGVLGGIVATLGFISPSFIIIFIIATILSNFSDIPQVQSAFKAIRVCVFVLVLSAILKLRKKSVFDIVTLIVAGLVFVLATFTDIPLVIFVLSAGAMGIIYNLYKQKILIKNEKTNIKEEE
jgi:chromate transporter